jgi:hypothetical protein
MHVDRKAGIVFQATRHNRDSLSWWKPGRGYVNQSEVGSICADAASCTGPSVFINAPTRFIVYVYDNLGTYAVSESFEVTAEDLKLMNPDQLDRVQIRMKWNLRGKGHKLVASGIYPWRIVSWVEGAKGYKPALYNNVIKVGVKR